jgi:phage tail-like protein
VTVTVEAAERVSSYLDSLPAIFRESSEDDPEFLGRFLLAFEHVLTGVGEADRPGLEETLDGIADPATGELRLAGVYRYFEPGPKAPEEQRAPAEFLEWLSGWVALTLRADLDELRQRDFIARAASLYRLRGTKRGLEEILRIYTRLGVSVEELQGRMQVAVSRLGKDSFLGGGAPHFFRVIVRLATTSPAEISYQRQVVRAIVDAEKPAHTHYVLEVETPSLQIGVHSTVGVDTLLRGTSM